MNKIILPIDFLFASQWELGMVCEAKLAYSRNQATSQLSRPTPYVALGNIRHGLEDAFARGVSAEDEFDAWFITNWQYLEERERDKLVKAWHPALVQAPSRWAAYEIIKAQLRFRIKELWKNRKIVAKDHKRGVNDIELRRPNPGEWLSEVTLIDKTNKLAGRVDRIEANKEGLILTDFKSTLTLASGSIPDQVRRQLIFYSGLVEAMWGEIPRLRIIGPDSEVKELQVGSADIQTVRESAVDFRLKWNSRVSGETQVKGNPSKSNCSWCAFQVICSDFEAKLFEFRLTTREIKSLSLAIGEVTSVTRLDNNLQVTIQQNHPLSVNRGEVKILGLPVSLEVSTGDHLRISSFEVRSPQVIRADWDSRIHIAKRS